MQKSYGIPQDGIPQAEKRRYVERKRQHSRRGRVVLTGLVALIFTTGLVISFYYAQIFITSYRIQGLQNQMAVLQEETDDLHSELAMLKSPDRIENIAVNKLDMVKPDGSKVVKVNVNIDAGKTPAAQGIQDKNAALQKRQNPPTGQDRHWAIQSFSDLLEQVKEGVPLF